MLHTFVLLMVMPIRTLLVDMTDLDLMIDAFSLIDGDVGDSELFEIGEMARMRFKFTAASAITDSIIIDITSAHNDFSAIIFCGDPVVKGSRVPKSITALTVDSLALPRKDSYIFDFGSITLNENEKVEIEFEVMLINHPNYITGMYWFGVAMGYNDGNSIFVSDIAFELDTVKIVTGDIKFDENPLDTQIAYEGAAYVTAVMTNPFDSVGFKFISEVDKDADYADSVCVCDIRINYIYASFQGCMATLAAHPPNTVTFDPPFNSTGCKKRAILDFGALTKQGSSGSADEIRIDIGVCLQAGLSQHVFYIKDIIKNSVDKSLTETTNPIITEKRSVSLSSKSGKIYELIPNLELFTLSSNKVSFNSALSFLFEVNGTEQAVYTLLLTMAYPTGMFEDVRGRYVEREIYTSPYIPQIIHEEEAMLYNNKSYTRVRSMFRKAAITADYTITSQKYFAMDITGRATSLAENINDDVIGGAYFVHDNTVEEELDSVRQTISFNSGPFPPQSECSNLEVTFEDLNSLVAGQSTFYAESFTSLTLILTMPEDCEATTYFKDLKVSFQTIIPTELQLASAYLFHAGDNFASVILENSAPVFNERSSITRLLYNSSATFYFNGVTYIPVNPRDLYDRQLKFQVNIFLSDKNITFDFEEDVTAIVNLDGNTIEKIVTLKLQHDVYTEKLLYVNIDGNVDTIRRESDPTRNPPVGYVQSQWPFASEDHSILGHNEQKIIVRFGFYITPTKFYNQYGLSVSLDSDNDVIITQRNDFGRNLESAYKFDTVPNGDFDGKTVIANMESFKNNTESDYQLITFLTVQRFPDTTSGNSFINMKYCYNPNIKAPTPSDVCFTYSHRVEFSSVLPTNEPVFNWIAYPPKIKFAPFGSLTPEFVKGGAFIRLVKIYVPFKTVRKYKVVAEINDYSDLIYISNMAVDSVGKYIIYTPQDHSTAFSQANQFYSPSSDKGYYKQATLDLGFINNVNYNLSRHLTPKYEIEECVINLKIVFGSFEEAAVDVNFEGSFQVEVTIYDEDTMLVNPAEYTSYALVDVPTKFHNPTIFTRMAHSTVEDPAEIPTGLNINYTLSFYLSPGLSDTMKVQVASPVRVGPEFLVMDVGILGAGRNVIETLDSIEMMEVEYINRINAYGMQEYICVFSLNTVTNHGMYVTSSDYDPVKDNELQFLVTIKLQDENVISNNTHLKIFYSATFIYSKTIASGFKKFIVAYPSHRRPIVRSHINSSMLVAGREPVPGDILVYTVHVYHACNSSSRANDVMMTTYFANYSYFHSTNTTYWFGVLPNLVAGGNLEDHFVTYKINKIQMTEYFRFTFYVKIKADDPFFVVTRIYFISLPVEIIFKQFYRNTDEQPNGYLFSIKAVSSTSKFTLLDSVCRDELEVHTYHHCRFQASSVSNPLTNAPEFANLKNLTGWQSNNFGGQYDGHQFLQFSFLDKYRITRIYLNFNTSAMKFRLEYCLDSIGIFWFTYKEIGEDRIFDIHDIKQSFRSDSMSDRRNPVYYLDIRVPFVTRWLRFVFLEASKFQITWRFMIAGCLNIADGNIHRICKADDDDIRRPEIYDRGFITDQDKRVLYVCEKNLERNENECIRVKFPTPNKFVFTYLSKRVHSIFGYCFAPFLRLFAVSSNLVTYLGSDDSGDTWKTVSAKEFWKCRDNVGLYKEVRKMPTYLMPVPVTVITDEALIDRFNHDGIEFRANHTGIYMGEDSYNWKLVYDWGRRCCSSNM